MNATEKVRPIGRSGRSTLFRVALLSVIAALLSVGLSAGPAATQPAATQPAQVMKAPSVSIQAAPGTAPAVKLANATDEPYVVNRVDSYYWGRVADVSVYRGYLSFGVYCTGWGWYNTEYVYPDNWRMWVDCGSYIPATNHHFIWTTQP